MLKLELKSTLLAICMFWEFNQKETEIEKWVQRLNYCEKLYKSQENKLGGFTEFDEQIQNLQREMKAKLWKSAQVSFVFMKAYPISIKEEPFIPNLIRKKNAFRATFKQIFEEKTKIRKNSEVEVF